MKKQILTFKKLLFANIIVVMFFLGSAYAVNKVAENIAVQNANNIGSNNSQITFSSGSYINVGNNSTVIGNYFSGYYYDSIYGFFQLDWDSSGEASNNVHVSGSTDKCSSGYGYKIGGYAWSENFGFIDFNYNDSLYVYYCLEDKQTYGYAYGELIGFQNFDGITFEIITESDITSDPNTATNTGFTNDSTNLIEVPTQDYSPNTVGTDIFEFKDTDESIFYIIK